MNFIKDHNQNSLESRKIEFTPYHKLETRNTMKFIVIIQFITKKEPKKMEIRKTLK